MIKKAELILPNPELPRERCVKECMGCERMVASFGGVCVAYLIPKSKWRMYEAKEYEVGIKKEKKIAHSNPCPLATHMTHEEVPIGKKWVNPLKASKRINQ